MGRIHSDGTRRAVITHVRRLEPWALAILLAIAGALWIFLELADDVWEGETIAFDRTILLALRNAQDISDPIGPPWFEEMARDVTALGSMFTLGFVSVVVVVFLALSKHWRPALFVFLSVAGGTLISTVLKNLFSRQRPDLVPHGMEVFTASFPSGHSMLSAVTYLTLGALLMRLELHRRIEVFVLLVSVILTFLVGASRVYLGVHWPSDVLAGWTVGAAWALICWSIMVWLQARGTVEDPVSEAQQPGASRSG